MNCIKCDTPKWLRWAFKKDYCYCEYPTQSKSNTHNRTNEEEGEK